jgi:hypothetical protein
MYFDKNKLTRPTTIVNKLRLLQVLYSLCVKSQILLYIFEDNQMYSSYNNRIENKAFKRALFVLLLNKFDRVGSIPGNEEGVL